MMIATLNDMPEQPTSFMQSYISLHYYNGTAAQSREASPRARAVEEARAKVGKADLARLKREIAELQAKKEGIQTYKSYFSNMHKSLHEISQADSSSLSSSAARGTYGPSARGSKASNELKSSKTLPQKAGKITEESENSSEDTGRSKK